VLDGACTSSWLALPFDDPPIGGGVKAFDKNGEGCGQHIFLFREQTCFCGAASAGMGGEGAS